MKTKSFDTVKMMRDIRDKLSREMESMSSEERLRFIRDRAKTSELWKKLAGDDENSDSTKS